MELLDNTNLQFNYFRDRILSESEANPIYASHFIDYYQEYFHRKPEKKLEFLVLHEGTVVLLFLLHDYSATNMEVRHFSYYGLPGIVAMNSKANSDIQELAMKIILSHLREIGALKNLRNSSFEITCPDPSSKNIASLEELISFGSSVYVYFERVIDLSKDADELVCDFSKSVKSAIKKNVLTADSFRLIDSNSPDETRKDAIRALKKLHFLSAGRRTRSDKTWETQGSLLASGSIVIGLGYLQEELIHGAMFMLADKSAFYAVSANSKELLGTSVAHPFIFRSILALKELGIQKIYMGRQFEELTRDITEKERNIAKFKSFFGGNLLLGFGLSNVKE